MKKFHTNSLKALTFSASALAFAVAGPLAAQEQAEEPAEQTEEEDDQVADGAAGEDDARITVTGSRIRNDTYTSISPLQVITTENQQAVGVFDPTQLLQRTGVAGGIQID